MSVAPADESRGRTQTSGSDASECAIQCDLSDEPVDATLAAEQIRVLRMMQEANS